jgi:hypothetical protein
MPRQLQSGSQNREQSADSLPCLHTTYSSYWSQADTQINQFRVPQHIEAKARELAQSTKNKAAVTSEMSGTIVTHLTDAPVKVYKIEEGIILVFQYPLASGPLIFLKNERLFRLDGECTWDYLFFNINGRLYLVYKTSFCCDCGECITYVYDLSGSRPKRVYLSGKISD